jgi:hypothetical protein
VKDASVVEDNRLREEEEEDNTWEGEEDVAPPEQFH